MKTYNSNASICIKDANNLIYHVCDVFYYLSEDETFKYIFKPNYSVISLLPSSIFQGIPGLNLDLRKNEYIRENKIPTFISERVINKNREDYNEILESMNMDFMDPLLFLIKTNKQYSGDNLFLIEFHEKEKININAKTSTINNQALLHKILNNICLGNDIVINDLIINDTNRFQMHYILLMIYVRANRSHKELQKKGIENAKLHNKYQGRKPIDVDEVLFLKMHDKVKHKKISVIDACKKMKISRDKYYRLLKVLQN